MLFSFVLGSSLELRVICAFFSVGLVTNSGACSCRITDQRLGCHRAVLFSRQCSQASAGVWHRAQPPQRSEEAAFGALFLQETHFSQFPRHSQHYRSFFSLMESSLCVCFVRFIDTSDDVPSQNDMSHVLVRLLLRRDAKTI